MSTEELPPATVSAAPLLTPDQQAALILSLAKHAWNRKPATWTFQPQVGDLVFLKFVPRTTPYIERIGTLIGHWSYVPRREEVWQLSLLNGDIIKWSNVEVLRLPVQLDETSAQ